MTQTPLPPEFDPRGRHRGRTGWTGRTGVVTLGRLVGVIVSVGLLVIAGYSWATFRHIDGGIKRLQVQVNDAPSTSKQQKQYTGTAQNILLVGDDDRSALTTQEQHQLHTGSGDGSNSTDTMMIMHIPANGSEATLISLPRDSYVNIPGFHEDKLNAAYVDGYTYNVSSGASLDQRRTAGADLLIKTVSNLTGLTINHYVQINLLGFYQIANALNGVPVTLCHSVDDTVQHNREEGVGGGSGFKMSAGYHVLNGVQSLEFVRQRHNFPNNAGDLDRVRRQQYFLTAAFRKVASVGLLFKLSTVGAAIRQNVYLDPGLDLIDLARQLENLSANHIIGRTIPTKPGFADGQSVLLVKPAQVQTYVANLLNPAPSPTSSGSASSAAPTTGTSSSQPTPSPTSSAPIDSHCID